MRRLVVLLALLLAEPAAATVTISAPAGTGTLQYTGSATSTRDLVTMSVIGGDTQVRFDIAFPSARADVAPQAPCVFQDGSTPDVVCPRSGIQRVVFDLGDGNDAVRPDFLLGFALPMQADGGAGSDSLVGGTASDQLAGGAGADALSGGPAADDLRGGADFDLATYAGSADPVTVTLDDAADDGAPSEGDNVHSDIEDVTGGDGNDTLVGSAAPNILEGGDGNDEIHGGAGADELLLGSGDDTARARDDVGDRIRCDDGTDSVTADPFDQGSDCESFAVNGDADADGTANPQDCDDANAAIHPGAIDAPDDGVDQDCSGADAHAPGGGAAQQLQRVVAPVLAAFAKSRATTIRRLVAFEISAGSTIELRCAGSRCPFARRTLTVTKDTSRVDVRGRLRLRSLAGSGTLELRITRPNAVGTVVRWTVRARTTPRRQTLCLAPGAAEPQPCG